MTTIGQKAIKLAGEILAQPQFGGLKRARYSPPRWCSLIAINEDCSHKRREQCQLCQWLKKKER